MKPLYLFELASVLDDEGKIEPGFGLMLALATNTMLDVSIWSSSYPETRREELMARLAELGVRFSSETPLARMAAPGASSAATKREWVTEMPYFDRVRLQAVYEADPECQSVLSELGVRWISGSPQKRRVLH